MKEVDGVSVCLSVYARLAESDTKKVSSEGSDL